MSFLHQVHIERILWPRHSPSRLLLKTRNCRSGPKRRRACASSTRQGEFHYFRCKHLRRRTIGSMFIFWDAEQDLSEEMKKILTTRDFARDEFSCRTSTASSSNRNASCSFSGTRKEYAKFSRRRIHQRPRRRGRRRQRQEKEKKRKNRPAALQPPVQPVITDMLPSFQPLVQPVIADMHPSLARAEGETIQAFPEWIAALAGSLAMTRGPFRSGSPRVRHCNRPCSPSFVSRRRSNPGLSEWIAALCRLALQ